MMEKMMSLFSTEMVTLFSQEITEDRKTSILAVN